MVTSRDVARAAGVSQATVSRVLSGGVVSEKTRQRVVDAIQAVGYTPNAAARAMRMGRAGAVGIVVADLDNPFYPQMLSALAAAFDEADFRVVVWLASQSGNRAALQAIRERTIDGVVFTTATDGSPELRAALDEGRPIVLVNRSLADVPCDQVASDNLRGGALVARHLLEHGRQSIAFIGGTPLATTSRARLRGFINELGNAGVTVGAGAILEREYSHAWGVEALRRLMRADRFPDAVFCANDLLAFGAIDGSRGLDLSVGRDLWVVGYDDIPMASWSGYSLTTVRQDIALEARLASSLLIQRIEGVGGAPRRELLEPELVVRASAGGVLTAPSTIRSGAVGRPIETGLLGP